MPDRSQHGVMTPVAMLGTGRLRRKPAPASTLGLAIAASFTLGATIMYR